MRARTSCRNSCPTLSRRVAPQPVSCPVTSTSLRTETPTTTPPASNCSAASAADSPGTDCIFSPKPSTTRRGLAGRSSPGSTYAQNWLDLSAERSLSSFNRTHTFNLNVQYSTGQGTSGGTLLSGWKGALAKDWTFATTLVAGSGLPETPIILQPRRHRNRRDGHGARGLHRRFARAHASRLRLQHRRFREAPSGSMGRRRAEYHHRARSNSI